jgi:chromosome segregation ATPase
MRKIYACVAAGLTALVACDRDPPAPAQQAGKALEAAREDIEKARNAIQATEAHSKQLEEKIQAQRAQLNELIERRLTLLRQQMKEDEERVRRLPAGKETEVQPRLAELHKQIDDVQAKLHAYRDAPREKAAEALAQLEKSLAALAERRRDLDAQLQAS